MFAVFRPRTLLGNMNWVSRILVLLLIPYSFWLNTPKNKTFFKYVLKTLNGEFKAIFGKLAFPGRTFILTSLFLVIIINNFWGLRPYIFTSSRHITFCFSMAFPLWVGHIIIAFILNTNSVIAHFVPLSTPPALIPFMVLIEFISRIIRPITLAIRLTANIIAGHLLLTLLREKSVNKSILIIMVILRALISLRILEIAVSVIQAYVFRLLSTLYINEVNNKNFI